MKRELAALATPSSESIRRKTRFSNSDEVSQGLVYKRAKRSSLKTESKAVGMVSGVSVSNGEAIEMEKNVVEGVCDEVSEMEVVEKSENGKNKTDEAAEMIMEDKYVEESGVRGNVSSGEGETEVKTPLEAVSKGRRKKFGDEQYQRRFTRSALQFNVVEGNEEKAKQTKDEKRGLEDIVSEDNDEGARRVTRSSLGKTKEDGPDSCLTETSDEEGERVEEDVENGIRNMDKNVEDNGTTTASPDKMLTAVTLDRIPLSVMELFETGLLEGCPVYYDGGKGPMLRGRIRAIGICCPCNECLGCKVVPPSLFEIHAIKAYKKAVQYIYLENGRSLIQILKACKPNNQETIEETVQNAIGPLPKRKVVVCQNCKEQFITADAECSVPVCGSCVMSNLSPVGPVYASRKLRRSSKFGAPQGSSFGKLQDCSPENSVLINTSKEKSAKKQAESFLSPKLHSSVRRGRTIETKTSEKSAIVYEEPFNVPKACNSPTTSKSVATKKAKKLLKKMGKESSMPKPSKTPSVNVSEKKTPGKITRKDLRLHKLVFEDDVLPDGTELAYYAKGKKLLDGYKKGSGIFCNCCEAVISASQFESHAGCAARRKPYCYIYTSNGVSLHELSVNLIKGREHSAKFNDDLCSICADGGNLLLCDGCPRAFHSECASLSSVPRGKWYCKYCENMFEREKFVAHNANALAAGRVSGVDPMEQITKRSIRIVNNVESDASSCILCRGNDFSKLGFGPRTIILCDQCEKEYHVGCLKDHDIADLTELPDGKWFCSLDCGKIDASLQNLLIEGPKRLPESLVNILRRKNLQNISESAPDDDISWRLLSGKIASPETRPLLSQAVSIFHESFAPIAEVVSGHDLIPAMVYGRTVGSQEYGGMHCAVLTVNSVVVSAAIFRVFGPEVAELPLVATSSGNHGKGYFQALFSCIESLLSTLKVKTFVLPAAEEAESIWTKRFAFKKMTSDQLSLLKKNFWTMVRFEGTSMLHKPIPEC